MAETPMTGRPPEMLQDCDRKLSMALSNTPGARLHAREAASEVEAARASPDTRSERERFEAWAHSMCMSVEREPFPTRQAYLSLATSNAWEGWKGCRASLPAPTDAEWMKEAERLEVVSAWNDLPEALKAHPGLKRLYRALGGVAARPAEPTPSVDVLRREELRDRVILAAKAVSYSNGFDAALPDKKAELYEALKALEKP